VLDAAPTQLVLADGAPSFVGTGDDANAAVFFWGSSSQDYAAFFTPGEHHYSSQDIESPVWSANCTMNESPSINHFDEPSETTVEVSPPDDHGVVTVVVVSTGASSNVTAVVNLRPVSAAEAP
jgi:hypothetical protein